jgi:hypothetical protein
MHKPQDIERKIFSRSKWIWPVDHFHDLHNSYALFRKVVRLEKVPRKAPLFITADQSYRLFINGRFVNRGPARGYQSHWPYDEVDVGAYLKKGKNLIAVRAYNPGHSTFQYLTQGYAGLLVAARWGRVEIISDATWKSVRQASTDRDTVQASMQLFCQEQIDLRKETGDWTSLSFDDADWIAPDARPWDAAPWSSLEARGIPLLSEKRMPAGKIIGIGEGVSASGYERVRDVTLLRYQEDRRHEPVAMKGSPIEVKATGRGKFRSYLIDFKKTVVGEIVLTFAGAQGSEIIDTLHVETIDETTLVPDQEIPGGCRMAFGSRLICRKGAATHHFYHHYGFRYLVLTVRDATEDFVLKWHFNWTGYPLDYKGSFASSDTNLEEIWQTCAWTQQCCSLDAYVDTPWREQAQWWGDARVQAWNTFHLNGDARLFRRGISQIGEQATADGVTYGHAPTMAHNCILPDFTLIWMLTLWDYYWQTGSTEALLTHHAQVQRSLGYFRKQTNPRTGLLMHDPRYWLFLDWTELFRDGSSTVYNLWLLITLDKLAQLYRKAGQPKEATRLEIWAAKLRKALERLIDRHGLMRDGVDFKGKIVPETSIHAQTLAIQAGLKGLKTQLALDRVLLPFIRGESKPKAVPSAYWLTYVFSVLIDHGYVTDVLLYIKAFWTPMVAHGTTWEGFYTRRGGESCSHAWSAHPLYHLMQTVGGITQTGPQWSEIVFKPTFHGTHGKSVVPSPRGPIKSSWQRQGDSVVVNLQLPKGVKARVALPGVRPHTVSKSSSWTILPSSKTSNKALVFLPRTDR